MRWPEPILIFQASLLLTLLITDYPVFAQEIPGPIPGSSGLSTGPLKSSMRDKLEKEQDKKIDDKKLLEEQAAAEKKRLEDMQKQQAEERQAVQDRINALANESGGGVTPSASSDPKEIYQRKSDARKTISEQIQEMRRKRLQKKKPTPPPQ